MLSVYLVKTWRSAEPILNQVEVVDIDQMTGTLRGESWYHVYSPKSTFTNIELRTQLLGQASDMVDSVWFSWQGLPGVNFGGMESGAPTLSFSNPYRSESAIEGGQGEDCCDALDFKFEPAFCRSLDWQDGLASGGDTN